MMCEFKTRQSQWAWICIRQALQHTPTKYQQNMDATSKNMEENALPTDDWKVH